MQFDNFDPKKPENKPMKIIKGTVIEIQDPVLLRPMWEATIRAVPLNADLSLDESKHQVLKRRKFQTQEEARLYVRKMLDIGAFE